MRSHCQRAFTIVELLVVIGIISILMGIVTTAASTSVKASRKHKAQASEKLLQVGIATYRAQFNKWPFDSIGSKSDESITLTPDQSALGIRKIIEQTKKGNPIMDISGLFVSSSSRAREAPSRHEECSVCHKERYLPNEGAFGMDFMEAIRGKKGQNGGQKMKTSQMYFGYPDPRTGRFMPFIITYKPQTDEVVVSDYGHLNCL